MYAMESDTAELFNSGAKYCGKCFTKIKVNNNKVLFTLCGKLEILYREPIISDYLERKLVRPY